MDVEVAETAGTLAHRDGKISNSDARGAAKTEALLRITQAIWKWNTAFAPIKAVVSMPA